MGKVDKLMECIKIVCLLRETYLDENDSVFKDSCLLKELLKAFVDKDGLTFDEFLDDFCIIMGTKNGDGQYFEQLKEIRWGKYISIEKAGIP